MSYIVDHNTSENFFDRLPEKERSKYDTVLSQFNYFTTDVYQKRGDSLLADLKETVRIEGSNDKFDNRR